MLSLLTPGVRRHRRNPFRLGLILLSIALGTGLLTFILLVNQSTVQSLRTSVNDLAGDTDLVVRAFGGEGFAETLLGKVLDNPGVGSAVPLVQNQAFLVLPDGAYPMNLLGLDLLNDHSLRGRGGAGPRISDPLEFMASPDSVALTTAFAKAHHLNIGEGVKMRTSLGLKNYTVRALLGDEGLAHAFGGSVVVMDLEASRLAYGKEGKLDQINVTARSKEPLPPLAESLRANLGDSFSVQPPSAQLQGLREIVGPFQSLLLFLGGAVSVMALFLISNAMRVAITERRSDVAVSRALGMTTTQVAYSTVFEFWCIGFIGAVLGGAMAWGVAQRGLGLVQAGVVAQTQVRVSLDAGLLPFWMPLLVVAGGSVLSALLAVLPALRIARTPPAESFGALAEQAASRNFTKIVAAAGVVFYAAIFFKAPAAFPWWHALPGLGCVFLAPTFCAFALRKSRGLARLFSSPLVDLAWGYAVDRPGRIERTVRALVLGLLLVFVISTVQAGFRDSLSQMFLRSARPDFYVSSQGDFLSPLSLQPLDDRLQAEIAKVPGVGGVFGQRIVTVSLEGRLVHLSAFDEVPPATLEVPYSYFEVVDRPVAEAGHELYHSADPSIFVSESFATLFHRRTGDSVLLKAGGENHLFRIVGLVRDFTAGGGKIYLSRNRYKQIWKDPLVTGIAIVLAKGAQLGEVRAEVEKRFGRSHGILITVDKAIKDDVQAVLQRSFANLDGIQMACLLVASLGFFSSFLLEIRGRQRELALLQVTGMSRRQLAIFLLLEAGLIGASASVITLVMAWPVAWRLVRDTLPLLLGWVVEFSPKLSLAIGLTGLGLFMALLASLAGIHWALGQDPAEGVKIE